MICQECSQSKLGDLPERIRGPSDYWKWYREIPPYIVADCRPQYFHYGCIEIIGYIPGPPPQVPITQKVYCSQHLGENLVLQPPPAGAKCWCGNGFTPPGGFPDNYPYYIHSSCIEACERKGGDGSNQYIKACCTDGWQPDYGRLLYCKCCSPYFQLICGLMKIITEPYPFVKEVPSQEKKTFAYHYYSELPNNYSFLTCCGTGKNNKIFTTSKIFWRGYLNPPTLGTNYELIDPANNKWGLSLDNFIASKKCQENFLEEYEIQVIFNFDKPQLNCNDNTISDFFMKNFGKIPTFSKATISNYPGTSIRIDSLSSVSNTVIEYGPISYSIELGMDNTNINNLRKQFIVNPSSQASDFPTNFSFPAESNNKIVDKNFHPNLSINYSKNINTKEIDRISVGLALSVQNGLIPNSRWNRNDPDTNTRSIWPTIEFIRPYDTIFSDCNRPIVGFYGGFIYATASAGFILEKRDDGIYIAKGSEKWKKLESLDQIYEPYTQDYFLGDVTNPNKKAVLTIKIDK